MRELAEKLEKSLQGRIKELFTAMSDRQSEAYQSIGKVIRQFSDSRSIVVKKVDQVNELVRYIEHKNKQLSIPKHLPEKYMKAINQVKKLRDHEALVVNIVDNLQTVLKEFKQIRIKFWNKHGWAVPDALLPELYTSVPSITLSGFTTNKDYQVDKQELKKFLLKMFPDLKPQSEAPKIEGKPESPKNVNNDQIGNPLLQDIIAQKDKKLKEMSDRVKIFEKNNTDLQASLKEAK